MKSIIPIAALCLLAAAAPKAQGQEFGDSRQGHALAQRVCAACHAVEKDGASPNLDAPTFPVIASTRGMSARALTVALQTAHRTMPNLVLSEDESRNVIAYILSLRGSR